MPHTRRDTAPGNCWHAWFDGTAAPNPGKIGLGVLLVSPDGARREISDTAKDPGCNNEAELLALLVLLDTASLAGVTRLSIFGDSKAVIDWVSGADETLVPHLAELVTTLRKRIGGFDDVRLGWIPRHRNGDADRLARLSVGLAEKPARDAAPRRRR